MSAATFVHYRYDVGGVSEMHTVVKMPVLKNVLTEDAKIRVYTTPSFSISAYASVHADTANDVMVTNLWGLTPTPEHPFFLPGGSYATKDTTHEDMLRIIWGSVVSDSTFQLIPMLGAFPRALTRTDAKVVVQGHEFHGRVGLPPTDIPLLVSFPDPAQPGRPFTVQVTFASSMLSPGDLRLHLGLRELPYVSVERCTIENTLVDFSEVENTVSVDLSPVWARSASQGVHPLPMPHFTVECVLTLFDDDSLLIAQSSSPITAQVSLSSTSASVSASASASISTTPLASGVAYVPTPLLPPVAAVRLSLTLVDQEGHLSASTMSTAIQTLDYHARFIHDLPGLVRVRLVSQEDKDTPQGSTLVVTLLITAQQQQQVTVETVKSSLAALAEPLTSLGYHVDLSLATLEPVTVDAMMAYICGGGTLCLTGGSCSWNTDCVGGQCVDGVCVAPSEASDDWTWVYIAVSAAVATILVIVVILLVLRYLNKRRHGSGESLDTSCNEDDKNCKLVSDVSLQDLSDTHRDVT
jgi:hypothetical protein